MTPAGKAKKYKAKTTADYEAFKATAGGWKEMDTDTLLAKIYADRKRSNPPLVKL